MAQPLTILQSILQKKLGYECQSPILSGYIDDWKKNDYLHHLTTEEQENFVKEFQNFLCNQ